MTPEHSYLGAAMLDAAREAGVERGAMLAEWVIARRWDVLSSGQGEADWRRLVASGDPSAFADPMASDIGDPLRVGPAYKTTARDLLVIQRLADLSEAATHGADDDRQILANALDTVIAAAGKHTGEHDTPASLAELMVRLTMNSDGTVLDPACGNGTVLRTAARLHPSSRLVGMDTMAAAAARTRLRLALAGAADRANISVGDAFLAGFPAEATAVLLQPPWGQRLNDEALVSARTMLGELQLGPAPVAQNGDWAWLALAFSALRNGGRAAVVMPPVSAMRHPELQRALLRERTVEAVISLPPGLLAHTRIGASLWLMRRSDGWAADRVLLVNASSMCERVSRTESAITTSGLAAIVGLVQRFRLTDEVETAPHIAKAFNSRDLAESPSSLSPLAQLDAPPVAEITHPTPERTMLTEVRLENYKSFGTEQTLPLAPLTLLYGANSAGKSSVIQSLLLLKQSIGSSHLVTQGSLINVGGFGGLVHKHNGQDVKVSFSYGVVPSWLPEDGTVDPSLHRSVSLVFAPDGRGNGTPVRTEYSFGNVSMPFDREPGVDVVTIGRESLRGALEGIGSGRVLYPFAEEALTTKVSSSQRSGYGRSQMRAMERFGLEQLEVIALGLLPGRFAGLPPQFSRDRAVSTLDSYVTRAMRLASGITSEISSMLSDMAWLGPLRPRPQRVYDRAGADGEQAGQHTALFLFDHDSVVAQVNEWLLRLEVPYKVAVIPATAGPSASLLGDLVAITLEDQRSGVTVTPADVGFGVSQVLPIVVELLARVNSVVLIEQPETHLHPRLQARLADLLIDSTSAAGLGNQAIVETHSEHLMLRVQRRIREGALAPGDVSVLYVDQTPSGQAKVTRLRLDSNGDFLDEWPGGFFDDRLDEMFGGN